MARVWMKDPHSGGVKIPPTTQEATRKRILDHAATHYAGRYNRIDIRFRGALCYIDAYCEPVDCGPGGFQPTGESREVYLERKRNIPMHLCRMRHFEAHRWSLAFYTYSNERYEPCFFQNSTWYGTPEEAFDVGAVYLTR